jgi:hypothetical protein
MSGWFMLDCAELELEGGWASWPARERRLMRRGRKELRQIFAKIRRRGRVTSSPAYRWKAAK